MPEYLAPGVYVEEVSFRAQSIEGVSTSVTGFVGSARFGPISGEPELLTNFFDFERIYGSLDVIQFDNEVARTNYLALAVRAFFDNGGTKLYVSRVYNPPDSGGYADKAAGALTFTARFPGSEGNLTAFFTARLSQNIVVALAAPPAPFSNLKNTQAGDVVFVVGKNAAVANGLYNVLADIAVNPAHSQWKLTNMDGSGEISAAQITPANMEIYTVTASVSALKPGRFEVTEPIGGEFSFNPNAPNYLRNFFVQNPESRQNFLTLPFWIDGNPSSGAAVADALFDGNVKKIMTQQALPFLMDLSLADLISVAKEQPDLGLDTKKMEALDAPTFTLPEWQQFSRAALNALGVEPLKDVTASVLKDRLKAIPEADKATELKKLLDPINLWLLGQMKVVPLEKLSLGMLKALGDDTLIALGADVKLKAFDGTDPDPLIGLTIADLQLLSTASLQKLGIAPLKTASDAQVRTATNRLSSVGIADLTPEEATALDLIPANLAALDAAKWRSLTVEQVKKLGGTVLTKIDAAKLNADDVNAVNITSVMGAAKTEADTTLEELAGQADLSAIKLTPLEINDIKWERLTLADIQKLDVAALTTLGIPELRDVTDDTLQDVRKATLATVTLAMLAKKDDALLLPLSVTQDSLSKVDVEKLALSELTALPDALLSKIGFLGVKELTPDKLQVLDKANPDKQSLANALGITTLEQIQQAHLSGLHLSDLASMDDTKSLKLINLSQAMLSGISQANLATKLKGKDFRLLSPASLQTIGMGIVAEMGKFLPPKPSDLTAQFVLEGGSDGKPPTSFLYEGSQVLNPQTGIEEKSGLLSFTDLDEISIVAAPGSSFVSGSGELAENVEMAQGIAQRVIAHCELMRYRVGVLDMPNNFIVSEARNYRSNLSSTHAAIYYPWIKIADPLDTTGRREIVVPPSGAVCGIYVRNDVENGVHKAPANEVVRGAMGLEKLLNKAQQDILNPEGIDCFRFFPGRGVRLWGARTLSLDALWKYVNVRRYFAYLEHSIDRGTQFAVFMNNNERLWANIRDTVTQFLVNEWRNNSLMGTRPEEAFFVRCDRSTMTQNDIDNGRLVCLIGVAVNKPAEFVIFRIGQWTADNRS